MDEQRREMELNREKHREEAKENRLKERRKHNEKTGSSGGKQRYKIKDKWLQMYPSLVKPSGGHLEDSDQNPSPKRENSEDIKRENSESIALIGRAKSSSKTECQEDIYDEDNDKDTGIEWVDDEAQRDKEYDYHEDYG